MTQQLHAGPELDNVTPDRSDPLYIALQALVREHADQIGQVRSARAVMHNSVLRSQIRGEVG
jgi:hypothetical protein